MNAELSALQAQPATWQPIDGCITFLVNGELVTVDARSIDGQPFPDGEAICKLTAQPALAMRYSHRNGEYEPPTEKGYFFCKGSVTTPDLYRALQDILYVTDWHDGAMLTKVPDEGFITINGKGVVFSQGEWHCQWWGPILAPWNTQPASEEAHE